MVVVCGGRQAVSLLLRLVFVPLQRTEHNIYLQDRWGQVWSGGEKTKILWCRLVRPICQPNFLAPKHNAAAELSHAFVDHREVQDVGGAKCLKLKFFQFIDDVEDAVVMQIIECRSRNHIGLSHDEGAMDSLNESQFLGGEAKGGNGGARRSFQVLC